MHLGVLNEKDGLPTMSATTTAGGEEEHKGKEEEATQNSEWDSC